MPFTTWASADLITAAKLNNDNSVAVGTDTARTVTVTHSWTAAQTFTGGWTAAAACTISSGGIAVTGNSTIAGTLGSVTTLTATTLVSNTLTAASGGLVSLSDGYIVVGTGTIAGRIRQQSYTISAGGTADLTIGGSATIAFSGVLIVQKNRTANATFSTTVIYQVNGRGTTMNFTALAAAGAGSGGTSTWTIGNSGTGGVVRVTDNVTENSEVKMMWIGTDAS